MVDLNYASFEDRPLIRRLDSYRALLVVCTIIVVAFVIFYARGFWPTIADILLTDGVAAAIWLLAAAGLGEVVIRPRRFSLPPALRLATVTGVGLGIFSLVALGLGLMGWLGQVPAILFMVIAAGLWLVVDGVALLRARAGKPLGAGDWLARPAGWHWLFVVAMPSLAVAVTGACLAPVLLWKPEDPHPYDVLSYHFQVPREWYDLGHIAPLTHNVFSYFPFNTEMHFLLAFYVRGGPWAGMYMAQFLCVGFVILAVLGVYGMVRLVASRAMATIAAVAVATMPWMTMLAPVAYVEGLLVLYAVLALAWGMVALGREDRGSWLTSLVVGGACAGLACGVKLTAGPMVLAAVGGGYLIAGLIYRHCARRAVYGSLIFVAVGLLLVSPWLVRNWAWVGNPVFPNATEIFGAGYFSPGQIDRFTAAHTVPPGSDGPMAATWHQIAGYWQYGFVLIPLALAGLGLALGARRKKEGLPQGASESASMISSAVVLAIVVLIVQWIFWAFFTHRIGRFFLPAIAPLALSLAGLSRKQFAVRVAGAVVTCGALVAFFVASSGGIHARMSSFAALGRQGVFGLQKMGSLHPELQAIYDRGGVVHFVGDAKLFLHNAPSAQLPYRTVFDLQADTDDVVTAWTGKPLSQLPEGQWVLIDPEEIHRLATTYRHVPDLPATFPGPRNRPFLMNREGEVVVPK